MSGENAVRRIKIRLVLVPAVLAVLASAWCVPNRVSDLRWLRSDARLRSELLRDVPPGTKYGDVLSYFRRAGRVVAADESGEAVDQHGGRLGGRGQIRVHLGGYRLVLRTDVEAVASFDDGGNLADVRVFKSVDAP